MATCLYCQMDPASGPDGACDFCRDLLASDQAEIDAEEGRDRGSEGGECARCGLALEEGSCPNERCPFADTFQDELMEGWRPPGPKERAHIERISKRQGHK
jgi:hypothetical protein